MINFLLQPFFSKAGLTAGHGCYRTPGDMASDGKGDSAEVLQCSQP